MDHLAPFRRYFRIAALCCTVASAIMTAWFGFQQNPNWVLAAMCAMFLVACSIASDYVILFVVDAWRGGRKVMLGFVALGAAFVFSLNLISNLGAVGWQRETVALEARVQNTRADMAQDQITESRASLEMWIKRLSDLEAQNAWATTINAQALRQQADAEASRGGCGPKCKDLKARVAVVEETEDLRKKIEATKAVLAKHRAKAETTDRVVAAPESQAKFFASLFRASLTPSNEAQTWTDRGLAVFLAVGLCIAPMLFSTLGWRSDEQQPPASRHDDEGTIIAPAPSPLPVGPPTRENRDVSRIKILTDTVADRLRPMRAA